MIEQILDLAIRTAGVADDPLVWRKRLFNAIGDVSGMLNEYSVEWQLAKRITEESKVFVAEYRHHRLESSSTRLIVTLHDDREDKDEEIRTERTDDLLGQAMAERLEQIAPGTRCRVWKYLDQISQDKKVRVLVHIEPLMARDEATPGVRAGTPTPPPARLAASSAGGGSGGAGAGSPAPPQTKELPGPPLDEALERLTLRQRVAVAQRAKDYGVFDIYKPDEDGKSRILVIIEEMLAQQEGPK